MTHTTLNGAQGHSGRTAPALSIPHSSGSLPASDHSPEPVAAPANPYAEFSAEALDAIILGMSEQLGRAVSGRDADSTWVESMSNELALARVARLVRNDPARVDPKSLRTFDAWEPNPYGRFSRAELVGMMKASTERIGRYFTLRSVNDRGGLLASERTEYLLMSMAERALSDSRQDPAITAAASSRQTPAADSLQAAPERRPGARWSIVTYSESGPCGDTLRLQYHQRNTGPDFPAATLSVLIPEYGTPRGQSLLTDGAQAMLEDAFRAVVEGTLPARYAAMDEDTD